MTEPLGTAFDAIADPTITVELARLKLKGGAPARVVVEPLDEVTIYETTQALPGYHPELGIAETKDLAVVKRLRQFASPMIEKSCGLIRDDGSVLRPAFTQAEEPVGGAIPIRYLSDRDAMTLFAAIMRASGWVGGPADSFQFRNAEREGGAVRSGGVGDRAEPSVLDGGSPAREGEGGPPLSDAGDRDGRDLPPSVEGHAPDASGSGGGGR